ncbi:murein biosynthesis integral membrane protein MurJ [Pontiellaceae bacterium B1224]|nr:murein biosynthesis integral membrane protein MurJ [Pontiellaceae bacterium B1224]
MKDGKVIRAAGVVGSFTLLSRGLGMLRDIIIAYHFGTSILASAFFVAFTLPNLFRRLFGEGALSAAFIPVFIETRTKQGNDAAWDMAAKVVTMTAALLSTIAIVGVLLFSIFLKFPCFSEKWLTTFDLSRIMFPYVLFICLAALSMAVLNSFKHFATSAFAPCLLNIILIVVMLVVFPLVGNEQSVQAKALAWGVLLAGISQVAIQLPALKRFGCPFKFSNHWNDPKIRQMLLLMGPAALGMAVTQFNVLIDRMLAMAIGGWAPAALYYSERWIYLPLGVIATAMSTVLLPTFSGHAAEKDHHAMSETLSDSLRHLAFIMTPAALGMLALAPLILQTLMEWGGNFDAQSTMLSTRALVFYAPGLILFSVTKVFVPAFYAQQDTKTPVRVGFITIGINLILNIVFILTLPEYWKHAGMAFSTVLSAGINIAILGSILNKKINGIQWQTIFRSFIRCVTASLIMAFVAWLTATLLFPIIGNAVPAKFAQMATLSIAIAVGALSYFSLAVALKFPELREIKSALTRK